MVIASAPSGSGDGCVTVATVSIRGGAAPSGLGMWCACWAFKVLMLSFSGGGSAAQLLRKSIKSSLNRSLNPGTTVSPCGAPS